MKYRIPGRRRGFTLVELLVTIAIIAILSALGVGAYVMVSAGLKKSRTETAITQIATTLENLHSKFGYYPMPNAAGQLQLGTLSSVEALTPDKIDFGGSYPGAFRKSFADSISLEDLKRICVIVNDKIVIADNWERPLRYRVPGAVNTHTFDLDSAGPDGIFGADAEGVVDDIGNY